MLKQALWGVSYCPHPFICEERRYGGFLAFQCNSVESQELERWQCPH